MAALLGGPFFKGVLTGQKLEKSILGQTVDIFRLFVKNSLLRAFLGVFFNLK
jgi:hypothetical protein